MRGRRKQTERASQLRKVRFDEGEEEKDGEGMSGRDLTWVGTCKGKNWGCVPEHHTGTAPRSW